MSDKSEAGAAPTTAASSAGSFDAFVTPHLPTLWRVARSLCHTSHDTEDLVQDTLLRAFRSRDTFDGQHARAWLLTIMRNADFNRHRRRRPGLLHHATDLETEADRRNPSSPSAEDVATRMLSISWVADALDRLSPRLRDVVVLVDIDGLTYDEAAVVLGIPAGTVMSRLHRARHRMRDRLTHHPELRS